MSRTTPHTANAMLASLLAMLIVTAPAPAGFSSPPGFEGVRVGTGPVSDSFGAAVANNITSRLFDRLRAYISARNPSLMGQALTDETQLKLQAVRKTLLLAGDLVECQLIEDVGPRARGCFKAMYDSGRICVDFGNASNGAQTGDRGTSCDKDKVNINISRFPCVPPTSCLAPGVLRVAHVLYEEIYHALQDWTPPDLLPADNADIQRAKWQRHSVCNERDVDIESIFWLTDIIDWLEGTNATNTEIAKKLQRKIAKVPAMDRGAAEARLLAEANARRRFDRVTRPFYTTAKNAFTSFINGTITKAQLNTILGGLRWNLPGQTSPLPQPSPDRVITYIATTDSGVVEQLDENTNTVVPLATGFDAVHDVQLIFEGDIMVISGTIAGQGGVIAIPDIDGDDVFESVDIQPVVPASPQFQLGLDLFIDDGTFGEIVYLYEATTSQIFPIIDAVPDGIPDTLLPPLNPPGSDFTFVTTWRSDIATGRILGFDTMGNEGDYAPGRPFVELIDGNNDGFYEGLAQGDMFNEAAFIPHLIGPPPLDGDNAIQVGAPPGADVQVWAIDQAGALVELLGGAFFPGIDEQSIPLARPLALGELLVLQETISGELSSRYVVTGPPTDVLALPFLQPAVVGNELVIDLLIESLGQPAPLIDLDATIIAGTAELTLGGVSGDAQTSFLTTGYLGDADLGVVPLAPGTITVVVQLPGGTLAVPVDINAVPSCGPADVTTDGTANGIPDGQVTLSDFSFYLSLWGGGALAADLTTDGTANGVPDGTVTLSDFSFYLALWGAGCP